MLHMLQFSLTSTMINQNWCADVPRFVNHVDDHFLQSVTALYRQRIPNTGAVLDIMSSHVSHLPRDNQYSRVVGHGMNAQEVQPFVL